MEEQHPKLVVSFRGAKLVTTLARETSVSSIKTALIEQLQLHDASVVLAASDIKLLWKGKVLQDNDDENTSLYDRLTCSTKKKLYRIVATGVSPAEKQALDTSLQTGLRASSRQVRDDLSDAGKRRAAERQRLGRNMLQQARNKTSTTSNYGFGRIEVLPNLPNQYKARAILTELANDPGVLACMAKHEWNVGSLAELYPDGKVGESAVCVMGLNKNKGQQILLRLRTDDLQGFRKPLSIRKVLYHELAHNVHSEHDSQFFQLMRQIEKECTELDWTQGAGLSSTDDNATERSYTGGAYRLGGGDVSADDGHQALSRRELAARAALSRMTAEEKEIEQNCGCGRGGDLFLPKSVRQQHTGNNHDANKQDSMDTSD